MLFLAYPLVLWQIMCTCHYKFTVSAQDKYSAGDRSLCLLCSGGFIEGESARGHEVVFRGMVNPIAVEDIKCGFGIGKGQFLIATVQGTRFLCSC